MPNELNTTPNSLSMTPTLALGLLYDLQTRRWTTSEYTQFLEGILKRSRAEVLEIIGDDPQLEERSIRDYRAQHKTKGKKREKKRARSCVRSL